MVRLGLDPVEKGYVGIGWMQLGDLAAIPPNRAAFRAAHAAAIPEASEGATRLEAGMLYRFLFEMKVGDLIVYPCREDRMIHLGEVTGDYRHVPTGDKDPNRRPVRWVKALPRSAFPDAVHQDFGNRSTLVQLKPNAAVYLAAIGQDQTARKDADGGKAANLPGGSRQGFGLSPEQRRLVEHQAMKLAADWLHANGFQDLRDVSATASCDYVAQRNRQDHVVEVKGTTGDLGSVILTANEVALHLDWHPLNLLILVHGISLSADSKQATGGELAVYDPWVIDPAALTPTAYSYALDGQPKTSKRSAARVIRRGKT
jgi:hypothetical protein